MFTQSTQIIYHTIPHCCNEWSIGAIVKKSSVFLLVYQFLWKPSPVYPDCTTAIDSFVIQSQIHFSTSVITRPDTVLITPLSRSQHQHLIQSFTCVNLHIHSVNLPIFVASLITQCETFIPHFVGLIFILSSNNSIPLYIFHIPCSICMSPFSSIRNSCSYTYSYIPRTPLIMGHIHFQLIFCFSSDKKRTCSQSMTYKV